MVCLISYQLALYVVGKNNSTIAQKRSKPQEESKDSQVISRLGAPSTATATSHKMLTELCGLQYAVDAG